MSFVYLISPLLWSPSGSQHDLHSRSKRSIPHFSNQVSPWCLAIISVAYLPTCRQHLNKPRTTVNITFLFPSLVLVCSGSDKYQQMCKTGEIHSLLKTMGNVLDDLLTSLHLAKSYFGEKYPEFSDKVQADCLFSCNFTVRRSSRKTVFSVLLIFWHLSGCILVRPHLGIEGLMSLTPTHTHTHTVNWADVLCMMGQRRILYNSMLNCTDVYKVCPTLSR